MNVSYQRIGERIRALRELKHLTLSDMEHKTNFTAKSLILAENGRAALSLEFLLSICEAMGVTPNDILKGQFTEPEFTLSTRESIIDEFATQVEEIMTPTIASRTKINDTAQTIEKFEKMVSDQKKDVQRSQPTTKKTWKSDYYR